MIAREARLFLIALQFLTRIPIGTVEAWPSDWLARAAKYMPLVGALISPSWHGFRYAGGIYHEPPTLLHVSRGLAGIHPIRWNCPPELALLTLVAA